jgi:long-chain acyl-CoA synthetase
VSSVEQATEERGVSAHARRRGDHSALIFGDEVRSYRDLDERARRLAAVLAERGAGPGRPVATVLPNGFEPFEVATAASMLAAPYLPVNWHLRADELAYILEDAGVAVAVGHSTLEGEITPAAEQAPVPGGLLVVGSSYEAALDAATPLDLDSGPGPELMFYTSGTTARPKGVVHGALADAAGRKAGMEGQVALWSWTDDDVYVMSGPAYHASHCGWALCALYVGATTVITERFEARAWLEEVGRRRGTRSFMVPAHFIRILELPEVERAAIDTSSFSLIVHAAAPCPVVVKQRMMEAFPDTAIHELYGASEGGATRISPEEWRAHPGSVGRPWPGVEIRILNEEGVPVPTGEAGLVYIRPPGGRRFSYRNDDAATAKAWRDDAFTVGDIGLLDDEGYLSITDRASDMVLWGGVNIAPREIEEVLYQHPDVVDCAVFGIPDERDGEHLKAIVQLRGDADLSELDAFVRARLASYKVPHVWEVTDELPRDQNGKVLKRLLRAAHNG